MTTAKKRLLAVVELGGYPNFTPLYQSLGFEVKMESSVRKAIRTLKQFVPDVVVAEFNFQSDFRDRTSSLESLLSTLQRYPHARVIVFYEKEYAHRLPLLSDQYPLFATLPFPIDEAQLKQQLKAACE
jgi:hypothetical protein